MNKLYQINKALTVDKMGESKADLKILANMNFWFSICKNICTEFKKLADDINLE